MVYANVYVKLVVLNISLVCNNTTKEMFLPGTVPMDTCQVCESDLRDLNELEDIIGSFGNYDDEILDSDLDDEYNNLD